MLNKKIIILILTITSIIFSLSATITASIYSEPGTQYPIPMNDYQKAVEYANNYCPVYESDIPDSSEGQVVGQTIIIDNHARIIIEQRSANVVYHELAHARWNATEEQADEYATKMAGPYAS